MRWRTLALLTTAMSLFWALTLMQAAADDHKHHGKHGDRRLNAPENQLYRETCGGCHLAYPPGLLPAGSWRTIVDGQSDHFGEDLGLSQAEQQELVKYLEANAADTSFAKLSRKIMKSLAGQKPLRITQITYIIHEHEDDDVPRGAFQRKSVGSFANCVACHPDAAAGDFDDDQVRIPAE